VIFVIVGAGAVHARNFLPIEVPGTAGLGRALILALFAFTGMETSLFTSGEVADPGRSIPRAYDRSATVNTEPPYDGRFPTLSCRS
jgi:amino acid permease